MKRLASLKSSSESSTNRWTNRRHISTKGKKNDTKSNNPYPLSGTISRTAAQSNPDGSYSEFGERDFQGSHSRSDPSLVYSGYENAIPAASAKSAAPTVSTNGDTAASETAYSNKAGTLATGGGGISSHGGGEGSTFSSPAPSVRSLTTTLTTVQSAAPSTQLYLAQNTQNGHGHGSSTQSSTHHQVQFSHQFPSSSTTATAVPPPPHLLPHGHSMTYSTATANNVLTDNASILTLASSSKRRRRNSLDTNASVRALAPSSIFGGSRESLPLSILSGNPAEPSNTSAFNAPGVLSRPSMAGLASAERISVYSSSGATPLGSATGERTSFHTARPSPGTGDAASIRSGVQSHSRNDSTAASISGGVGSPLAMAPGRISRRSSGWGEITGDETDDERPVERKDDDKGMIKTHDDSQDEAKQN
ncbi:hypothetical protein N7510_006990 [Penicillium lagena]|uniref:uncharacterized protein n=1 Tax=Penicillium lagena TaxID=94218 RepID=UPI0025401158|nr:uncharacterized protein N7510_006990 [Penicillium lagena]KAJ5610271.1 hypothetical protein N7510_006990 [Penicillium lagena]